MVRAGEAVIVIRPLSPSELVVVDAALPLSRLDSLQTYLVAWEGKEPIGHAHIAWVGGKAGVPEVQDVFVPPERRRQGIATALTRAAERLAAERGFERISLSVSETGNDAARALYEGLGYRDAGIPPQRVQGTIVIRGEPLKVDDTLLYLIKQL